LFCRTIDNSATEALLFNKDLMFVWYGSNMTKKRKQQIERHVQFNDYFGTLAAVLKLLGDDVKSARNAAVFELLVDDLVYLQDNYQITKQKDSGFL
jgi:hypothetical protein